MRQAKALKEKLTRDRDRDAEDFDIIMFVRTSKFSTITPTFRVTDGQTDPLLEIIAHLNICCRL